ncbi:4-phosphoerythronate dehydrogenase [Shewanella litorisediminis]|uniref:Erythronate-4-phosphate dehydrogenase n=1 Tax=Shewanella litorisediminis TaxID=1173586 RepID=A0ABX7FZI4_9GAMM|nr:4-phosphoerythronate dehydrogenase [Shewanella litorisediminis]MCL2919532.1 4-phosphoerythronate dehydrogenase [Shewanella litorisediminis]QRH00432.1 4-phosphoerythronate dehydrogenase [Shewanella litorisediminis]
MKIIADENMPYVDSLFGELGEIEYVNGRTLTPEQVADADVLLVRSVTQVNEALVSQNQQLKFVGSATIGTDHVDKALLASRGIPFSNAPGCNATAVGEYAFIAMLELAQRYQQPLKNKRVAIIGAGNTGSATARCLQAYGVEYRLCDPLLAEQGDSRQFFDLDELIAWADVISLHVPITKEGDFPTWYLFDQKRLEALKPDAWLLNCCRGEVIDNRALIDVKQKRDDIKLVLDVWEGEPSPMLALVPLVDIATPHIAGYSLEGKARGTFMLYEALCRVVGIAADKKLDSLLPSFFLDVINVHEVADERALLTLCRAVYDLRDDDVRFRQSGTDRLGFDKMRKNHRHRREFSALKLENAKGSEVNWLSFLGFSNVG